MDSRCSLHDGSIYIGLTSLPLGQEDEFVKSLSSLFDIKKNELELKMALGKRDEEDDTIYEAFRSHFYKPKYYYLFGKFDLVAISLIEGFNFPVRQFNFYNFQESSEEEFLEFSRHSILGPTPKFNQSDIISLFERVGFDGNTEFPLISITRLKINDFYLFEFGVEFLRACIKAINSLLRSKDFESLDFEFLLLESYGWSELTIIFFCKEFNSTFNQVIPVLRSLTKAKILDQLRSLKKNDDYLIDLLETSSNHEIHDFDDLPIFLDSHSITGFDYDMFANGDFSLTQFIPETDKVMPLIQWSIKPGCFSHVLKEFKSGDSSGLFGSSNKAYWTAGKSDIYLDLNKRKVPTRELIEEVCSFRKRKELIDCFNRCITTISIPFDENEENLLTNTPSRDTFNVIREKSLSLIFTKEELKTLRNNLTHLKLPHVTKEALLNFFSIFNNNVVDPLSFASFLELRPFLEYVTKIAEDSVNDYDEKNTESIVRTLDYGLHSLYYSYNNRILGSYANGDQYDNYMFLTIGSHALVSAFDSLYKCISRILGNPWSFTYAEGDHEFTTSDYALRINYFHMFNPELLSAVVFQEVCNQCRSKFIDSHPNLFHFHRERDWENSSEKIDPYLHAQGLNSVALINEYREILELMRNELFEHIFADIVGYTLFYQGDSKLYLYWSWGFFSTDPKHYHLTTTGQSEIRSDRFLDYLLRQLIVLKLVDPDYYESYQIGFDSSMNDLEEQFVSKTKYFIDNFFNKGDLKDWLLLVKRFGKEQFKTIYANVNKEIPATDAMRQSFLNGEVVIFNSRYNACESFVFTRNLLYSYLDSVFEVSSPDVRKNILERNQYGNLDHRNYSKLLFDPLGGTYIIDAGLRRELYKMRSSFHMSLVDMSLKDKGKCIQEYINQNPKVS